MQPLLRFPAADIRLEGIEVDVVVPPSWLDERLDEAGIQARGSDGGRVVGRLSRSDDDIVVRCRVRAAVAGRCVRCLDPAPIDVDAELSLLLRCVPRVAARGARGGARPSRPKPSRPKPSGTGPSGMAASRPTPSRTEAGRTEPFARAAKHPARSAPSHRGIHADDLDEYEFSAAEAGYDVYDGEVVELDELVREAILLEVPNFPLCSEGCAGIRPGPDPAASERAEAPTPVDPRLAPLGAFRKNMGGVATMDDLVAAAAQRSAAMGRKPILRSSARRAHKKK